MLPSLPFNIAWIGFVIAAAQTAVLVAHVWRRFPSVPKRVPSGIRLDGRPGPSWAKGWLWVTPTVFVAVLAILVAVMIAVRLPEEAGLVMLLVFLAVAEAAWFAQWTTDRQIEMARGMTYRIAPARLLLALLPILATIALTIVVAITQSL